MEEGFSACSMCAVQSKFELKKGTVIKGICIFVLIDRIDKKRVQIVVDLNEVIIFLDVLVH